MSPSRRASQRTLPYVALVAALALLLTGCSTSEPDSSKSPSAATAPAHAGPSTPGTSQTGLAHIVIIVDENKPETSVIGNPAAPYLTALAKSYALATNYSAITHPSLPNYLALTSGSTDGISTDCNPPGGSCTAAVRNISDEISASGRSWRMYAEGMPTPCTAHNVGNYAVKHVPFLYYPDVTKNASYCAAHVVPYSDLATDLAIPTQLPNYSFVSPDLCDDMHSCSIKTGDTWMAKNVPRILKSPAFTTQRSLLIIAFDEGDSANNIVACIFAGSAAKQKYTTATPYTHYSLLRTVESVWDLPPLTRNDAAATPMLSMLN
jgi:phosphatidylinositol-3-phosphatase